MSAASAASLGASLAAALFDRVGLPRVGQYFNIGASTSSVARRGIGALWQIYEQGYGYFISQRIAQWVNGGFTTVHLHNPAGMTDPNTPGYPMEGDQFLLCRDSGVLELESIYFDFASVWQPYTAAYPHIDWTAYIGNFWRDDQTTDWTALNAVDWATRRDESVQPLVDGGFRIGLDVGALTPEEDRNTAWYATLAKRPLMEPYLRPGYSHLSRYPCTAEQTYYQSTASEYAPATAHRTRILQQAGPDRDAACLWAYRMVLLGVEPLVPAESLLSTDGVRDIIEHGATLHVSEGGGGVA